MGHSSATFCIDCGWSGEHGDLAVDELGLQCPNCAALIAFVENRCTGAKVSLGESYGWEDAAIRRRLADGMVWEVPLAPYAVEEPRTVRCFGPGERDRVAGREVLYRRVTGVSVPGGRDGPEPRYQQVYVQGWIVDETDEEVLLEGVTIDEIETVHRAVFDGEPERIKFNAITGVLEEYPLGPE